MYAAADAYDEGDEAGLTAKAAMAKLAATETAQFVVDGAIQILGARALEEAHPLSHLYREVRAPRIYEGTSEIQRNVIAKWVLGSQDGRPPGHDRRLRGIPLRAACKGPRAPNGARHRRFRAPLEGLPSSADVSGSGSPPGANSVRLAPCD